MATTKNQKRRNADKKQGGIITMPFIFGKLLHHDLSTIYFKI